MHYLTVQVYKIIGKICDQEFRWEFYVETVRIFCILKVIGDIFEIAII